MAFESLVASALRSARSRPYVLFVAFLSCINVFVLILSGATAALLSVGLSPEDAAEERKRWSASQLPRLSSLRSRRKRRGDCSRRPLVCTGTRRVGRCVVKTKLPNVFESSAWTFTKSIVDKYGFAGVLASSTLPLIPIPRSSSPSSQKWTPRSSSLVFFWVVWSSTLSWRRARSTRRTSSNISASKPLLLVEVVRVEIVVAPMERKRQLIERM